MIGKKDLIVAFMVGFCVMALLFAVLPTRSASEPVYDPWTDLNDDGVIDSTDLGIMGSAWPSWGTPITKASIAYDTGWLDIRGMAGMNLPMMNPWGSTDDLMFDLSGRTTADGAAHQRYVGLTGSPAWNKTYGTTGDDEAYCVIQTSDEGYLLVGYDSAAASMFKTSANGKIQWTTQEGWTREFYSVVQTSDDGGYLLAGHSSGYAIIEKCNALGKRQWWAGDGNGGAAYSAVETRDGAYAIGGYGVIYGNDEIYLGKWWANSTFQWGKYFPVEGAQVRAYSLVRTLDDGFAIAGFINATGLADFLLLKTDADGNQQWMQAYHGSGTDIARSVIQTADGGFAVAGFTDSYGSDGDFWLVKTDSSGIPQWNNTYGGGGLQTCESIVQTDDGGYAMAGGAYFGGDNWDAFVVKVDADGNVMWSNTRGGLDYDYAHCIIQTSDGGYALAGATKNWGAGDSDFWLLKINVEMGFAWTGSNDMLITFYRGATDPYWNYVRIRIWKIKTTP